MMKYALPLALAALLALNSCRSWRHNRHDPHEEATPVSELTDDDFTHVNPHHRR